MVVYEIERFIRKTKAHYRLGGAMRQLSCCYCRSSGLDVL